MDIGARLRQAREERRLSQQELGELLGYAPTMISAFEKGRRRLKVEDLTRACIALGKEPEYFLRTATTEAPRRIAMALRAEIAQLPQSELARSIDAFLDELERNEPCTTPVPDLSHLRPEAAASEVLDSASVLGPPVETTDVAGLLGVPILKRALPDALSALIIEVAADRFVMGVNADHPPKRRRFSAAHELGHAVLRHEASYYVEYAAEDAWEPPGYRYLDEREANAFGAALLMDERWVRRDFASGLRDVRRLAERYEVSEAAMGFRLVNLALS